VLVLIVYGILSFWCLCALEKRLQYEPTLVNEDARFFLPSCVFLYGVILDGAIFESLSHLFLEPDVLASDSSCPKNAGFSTQKTVGRVNENEFLWVSYISNAKINNNY